MPLESEEMDDAPEKIDPSPDPIESKWDPTSEDRVGVVEARLRLLGADDVLVTDPTGGSEVEWSSMSSGRSLS